MIRTAAIVVGMVALGGLAACPTIDLGEDPSNPAICRPDPAYFRAEIWPNYINVPDTSKSCIGAAGCHREADGRSGLRFDASATPDLERNYQVAVRFLRCSSRDSSTLYTRPLAGEDSHGGGDLFTGTDPQAMVFRGLVPMNRPRRLAPMLVAAAIAVLALIAIARDARADAYLRVIAQDAPVYSGPGASYRSIYDARRGEVFEVVERGTRGYWFRVVLDDGTTGWIFGELVFPFEVGPEGEDGLFARLGHRIRRAILGPSPLPYAAIEISFSAGLLDREGLFLLRPAVLLDPYFSIEGFAGLSPRAQTDVFLAGAGWTLRMAPGAPVGPFVHASLGAAHIRPKADNFVDPEETLAALDAGGGFEITFKKQITLRTDYRHWVLFDRNRSQAGHEVTGGLAIFF